MNNIREKLIDILNSTFDKRDCEECCKLKADELISAGLIFNPETDVRTKFKVGQEVFYITAEKVLYSARVLAVEFRTAEVYYTLDDDWGGLENEFFATESEARAALKALNGVEGI